MCLDIGGEDFLRVTVHFSCEWKVEDTLMWKQESQWHPPAPEIQSHTRGPVSVCLSAQLQCPYLEIADEISTYKEVSGSSQKVVTLGS